MPAWAMIAPEIPVSSTAIGVAKENPIAGKLTPVDRKAIRNAGPVDAITFRFPILLELRRHDDAQSPGPRTTLQRVNKCQMDRSNTTVAPMTSSSATSVEVERKVGHAELHFTRWPRSFSTLPAGS
jgi:hypothetical protein